MPLKPVLTMPVLSPPACVGVIGTYLPRRSGVARCSAELLAAMREAGPESEFWSLAMNDVPDGYDYPPEVRFEIGQKVLPDYRNAVDFLDMNEFDTVCLQHEFGIYGGKAGNNILRLLQN